MKKQIEDLNNVINMYEEEQSKNIQLKKQYEIMKSNAEFLIQKNEELQKKIKNAIDILQEMRKDDYYNGIGYELSYLESILKGDNK